MLAVVLLVILQLFESEAICFQSCVYSVKIRLQQQVSFTNRRGSGSLFPLIFLKQSLSIFFYCQNSLSTKLFLLFLKNFTLNFALLYQIRSEQIIFFIKLCKKMIINRCNIGKVFVLNYCLVKLVKCYHIKLILKQGNM